MSDRRKLLDQVMPLLREGSVSTRGVKLRAADGGAEMTPDLRDQLLARCVAGEHVEVDVDLMAYEQAPGEHNRNFIRFRDEDLEAIGASGVGTPFIRDHRQSDALAKGGTITHSVTTKDGDRYVIRQTARLSAPWAVDFALRNLLAGVSIGMWPEGMPTCSVCGTDVMSECYHFPGDRVTQSQSKDGQTTWMRDPNGDTFVEWVFRGVLIETSACSVPAVPNAGVDAIRAKLSAIAPNLAAGDGITPVNDDSASLILSASPSGQRPQEPDAMKLKFAPQAPETDTGTAPPALTQEQLDAKINARAETLAAQKLDWLSNMRELSSKHNLGLDDVKLSKIYSEHGGARDEGVKARFAVLELIADKPAPTVNGSQRVEPGADESDKRTKLAAASILLRAFGAQKLEQALKLDAEARRPSMESVSASDNEVRRAARLSLNEIGQDAILAKNPRLTLASFRGHNPAEVADIVMGKTTLSGQHTVSDFDIVVETVLRVGLRQQFKQREQTWKRNSRVLNQDDFESKKYFGGGRFPAFLKKTEAGVFKRGTWGTSDYELELEEGGRIVTWSKQLQLADRIDMVGQIISDAANAAVRYENRVRTAAIVANVLPDGSTLFFDTDNTSSTTGTPSVSLLKAGMVLLADLAAPNTAAVAEEPVQDDDKSGEFPAFWHVGMPDHIDASQLLGDGFVPTAAERAPTDEMRRLRNGLILDTWLESQGTPFSMLTLDPSTLAAFGHGYLTSENGPVFERQRSFETGGYDFKASLAFNFWLLERLAAVKLKRS